MIKNIYIKLFILILFLAPLSSFSEETTGYSGGFYIGYMDGSDIPGAIITGIEGTYFIYNQFWVAGGFKFYGIHDSFSFDDSAGFTYIETGYAVVGIGYNHQITNIDQLPKRSIYLWFGISLLTEMVGENVPYLTLYYRPAIYSNTNTIYHEVGLMFKFSTIDPYFK